MLDDWCAESRRQQLRGEARETGGSWRSYVFLLRQAERAQDFVLFAQVADDVLPGCGRNFNQRGCNEDRLGQRAHRFLQDVDDFDAMALGKMFAAKRVEIRESAHRVRGTAGEVEPEDMGAVRMIGHSDSHTH